MNTTTNASNTVSPPWLLLYSAADRDGLTRAARADAATIGAGGNPAAAGRRDPGPHRMAVVADDVAGLVVGLTFFADGLTGPRCVSGWDDGVAERTAWCFGGHGSQWLGMGRALAEYSPEAAEVLDELDILLPGGVHAPLAADADRDSPATTQPLIFAVQVATARWLSARGLRPAAVIGHSLGEVAAAHVAGALTLADAARVVATRSRLLEFAGGGGTMATVALDAAEAALRCRSLDGTVVIAAHSAPKETVVTGNDRATHRLVAELQAEGVRARLIRISAASHSPYIDPVLPRMRDELAGLSPRAPHTPWVSTVDPGADEPAGVEYWVHNLRRPVLFAEAVSALAGRGIRSYLEIGPHPVLLAPLRDTLRAEGVEDPLLTASGHRGTPEPVSLLRALGGLYCRGARIPTLVGAGGETS